MNEPMQLVLAMIGRLGGRGVPLSRLLAALPGSAHISAIYIDDLAMRGLIIIKDQTVTIARAPSIVGNVRCV